MYGAPIIRPVPYRQPESAPIVIGADVGQSNDPSAIAVGQVTEREFAGKPAPHYAVRRLERLPLGTRYSAAAARIAEVATNARKVGTEAGHRPPKVTILIDATSIGRAVAEQVRDILAGERDLLKGVRAVTITAGEAPLTRNTRGGWSISKAALVGNLITAIGTQALTLQAGLVDTDALISELLTFDRKQRESGHVEYGAMRTGEHDDLAVAVGLMVSYSPLRSKVRAKSY